MCYSAESSGGTFLFVAVLAAFLYTRGKIALALVLLVLAVMQLAEYVIWNATPACTNANYIASSSIPVILALQPTLLALILWWYPTASYAPPSLLFGLVCLLAGATVGVLLYTLRNPRRSCVAPSQTGHLNWEIDPSLMNLLQPPYYAAMAFLTLSLSPSTVGIPLYLTYFLSWLYYRIRFPEEWPSLWCHGINGAAVVAVLTA